MTRGWRIAMTCGALAMVLVALCWSYYLYIKDQATHVIVNEIRSVTGGSVTVNSPYRLLPDSFTVDSADDIWQYSATIDRVSEATGGALSFLSYLRYHWNRTFPLLRIASEPSIEPEVAWLAVNLSPKPKLEPRDRDASFLFRPPQRYWWPWIGPTLKSVTMADGELRVETPAGKILARNLFLRLDQPTATWDRTCRYLGLYAPGGRIQLRDLTWGDTFLGTIVGNVVLAGGFLRIRNAEIHGGPLEGDHVTGWIDLCSPTLTSRLRIVAARAQNPVLLAPFTNYDMHLSSQRNDATIIVSGGRLKSAPLLDLLSFLVGVSALEGELHSPFTATLRQTGGSRSDGLVAVRSFSISSTNLSAVVENLEVGKRAIRIKGLFRLPTDRPHPFLPASVLAELTSGDALHAELPITLRLGFEKQRIQVSGDAELDPHVIDAVNLLLRQRLSEAVSSGLFQPFPS